MARRVTEDSTIWDGGMGRKAVAQADSLQIADMLEAVNLVAVLESDYAMVFTALSSGEYQSHCPFPDHRDSTPSFSVNVEKGVFLCRGCQRGGSILQFIMAMEGASFPEALQRLAQITGTTLSADIDDAAQMRRATTTMVRAMDAYFEGEKQATRVLPGGMEPNEFFLMLAARLRTFELDRDDSEETAWVDSVYEEADQLADAENWSALARLWRRICDETRERRKAAKTKEPIS